jgi:hypothetical protein
MRIWNLRTCRCEGLFCAACGRQSYPRGPLNPNLTRREKPSKAGALKTTTNRSCRAAEEEAGRIKISKEKPRIATKPTGNVIDLLKRSLQLNRRAKGKSTLIPSRRARRERDDIYASPLLL